MKKTRIDAKTSENGDLSHIFACKKLDEEDQHCQDVSILLRSKKYANIFVNIQEEFRQQFCDLRLHDHVICMFPDPFNCNPERAPSNVQLEPIKLQESSHLKSSFQDFLLDKFYFSLPALTYFALCKHVIIMASLLGSTYICQKTFSVLKLLSQSGEQYLPISIFLQSFKF